MKSNLLHFIKRNKHPFERRTDKNSREFQEYVSVRQEMDDLRQRNSQFEEYLNSLIVQNSKILEDNKYLCLELLKSR